MPNAGASSKAVTGTTPPKRWSWRHGRRGEVLVVALLAGLFATALILIGTTIYIGSLRQDEAQLAHEQLIVSANLKSLERQIGGNVVDYAYWDDAVDHLVISFDANWAARNVGPTVDATLGYELSLVLNQAGNPSYGQVDGTTDTDRAVAAFGPDLAQFADQGRGGGSTGKQPAVAVLEGAEGLVVAAASAVGPEEGSTLSPPPGPPAVLLFGKRLDQALLNQIEDDYGLVGLAFVAAKAVSADLASVALIGPGDRLVGHIAWPPHHPGRDQLAWMLPALTGALIAIGIFSSLALHRIRLTSALRRTEARLRDFAEVSSDWLWESDAQQRIAWLSSSFAATTGLAPERLLGRRRDELGGTALGDVDWPTHRRDLAAQRAFRGVTYALEDDAGRKRILRIAGKPVHDRRNRFRGYRGTGRDVTEEWEAAQRLRESENRFRSLVENLRGIIFCRGIAGDGPYGYDERGIQVFGADAMRLAGAVATSAWYSLVHPDDLPAYLAAERRRKEQDEPYSLDYRIVHADTGEERWLREVAWVVDAPDEGRRYLDSYIIDVTDHKRSALALRDSEARLQLALAAGGMGTWDVDLRTGEERWNDVHYRLFGVDPATFTPSSATFTAMVDPRDRDGIEAIAAAVLAGERPPEFTNDYRIVRPDGTSRWIGGGGRLLRDGAGQPERLLGVSFDITERKERELELEAAHRRLAHQAALLERRNRELEAANQAKSRFVANVSHEIRTPMNAVLGFADLLAGSGLEPAQQRYVEIIRDTGRQLLTLLNDILDIAKLEAGRLDLERVDFALAAVLEQVRSLLAPQAVERGLELEVEALVPASLVLRGDPNRLRQVLVNLVGNGLKFTAQGSVTLRVQTVESNPDRLRFEVVDTGIGIAPARQTELFQPFVQADSSITRDYGGTGLGLVICKSLVAAMDGTIGLDSAPGRGSRFWFELPLERGDAVAAAGRAGFAPTPIRPLAVLVADDVAANRELLGEILSRHGHQVRFAADGAAAVAQVAQEPPDVVLMDIQMPVMDGLEATRRIRLLPAPTGKVPILALTANVMANDRERYLASGMDRCLTKPVVWPELFAALAAVAGSPTSPAKPRDPALAASPAPPAAEPPLLDRTLLAGLARNLPPGALGPFLARGLDGAIASCTRLRAAMAEPDTQAREAHRLRGTAGTFGLARIAALAAEIEDRLRRQEDVAPVIESLDLAVPATRSELDRLLAEQVT